MSNQVQSLKLNDRIALPAVVTRGNAKFLINDLYGTDAGAFALADSQAARDSFIARCTALAMAAMIYGDSSRLERMKRYASTLPSYKTDKAGLPTGRLGKLIAAYGEAVSIGRALASQIDAAADEVSLAALASSPVFGALIAPPQPQPKAGTPSAGVTASAPPAARVEAAVKEAAEKAEKERYEARGRAAAYRIWNETVGKQRADSDARRAAAEKAAREAAWLAEKAAERMRDAETDDAIAAMQFVALAERLGVKLTAAQLKKVQAFAQEHRAVAA